MTCINPRLFLDDQFPIELRSLVPTTLRSAYRAADELIADSPIASIAERRGERGRIVAWSVDLAFSKLVETGALPFDKSWEDFEKPTGRYLALRASSSIITISQIADPAKQPRNVRFRPLLGPKRGIISTHPSLCNQAVLSSQFLLLLRRALLHLLPCLNVCK